MRKTYVGEGHVELIAGGGRIYTDVAARFVRSEKPLREIIEAPYSKELVRRIIESGHKAALEFDYFLFGVEGYSRVTEVQLVRKRIASYMIKTGRADKGGRRSFDVVIPRSIEHFRGEFTLPVELASLPDGSSLKAALPEPSQITVSLGSAEILQILEAWFGAGVADGVPEEDLRYLKPQATEFKGIIGMNAHALIDWFAIRCCRNAQTEIRDLATKMLKICQKVAPDLFAEAGANCKVLGYCPENDLQHPACRGKIPTKKQARLLLKAAKDCSGALEDEPGGVKNSSP